MIVIVAFSNVRVIPVTCDCIFSNVKVVPVGLSRGVRKLIKAEVPDLSRFSDVSDFITK